ncbi:guanine nucleotide binding protein, alpha subunit [Obelidium mucronatum]|nr:guanine nucleotide binding protein, alpha subunit [Obelidium mucronatum]
MGCVNSKEDSTGAVKTSKEIDRKLRQENSKIESEQLVKLLLLGPGEAGKSTILKQLTLLYGSGFTDQEVARFGETIRSNLITSFSILIRSMEVLKIPYGFDPTTVADMTDIAKEILCQQLRFLENPDCVSKLTTFWEDSGVQYCFSRAHEYQMLDCCQYVMANIPRICASGFIATEADILNSRARTFAVTETRFKLDSLNLVIYDVGGQRSERSKWAQFFDDTQSIIFVASIGSYDQTCEEDASMNRVLEAMNLFGSICNHPLLKSIDVVLFLNKIDIFKQKIVIRPISQYFPEYAGGNTYEETSAFFRKQFKSINKYPKEKKIFVHFTHATDSKLTKKILGSVVASITDTMLKSTGFV